MLIYSCISSVSEELEVLVTEYKELVETANNLQVQRGALEEEKFMSDMDLEGQKSKRTEAERKLGILTKDIELEKEKEITLTGDR